MSSNGTGGALQAAKATRTDRYNIPCTHWIIFTTDELSDDGDNCEHGLYVNAQPPCSLVLRFPLLRLG